MAARREYFDGCAAAHALDIVGERWALLVVRELALGPKRFTDIKQGLPKASPNVLSQRLRELVHYGVVRRRKLPPPAATTAYELTEWGHGLAPVLQGLARWGVRSPWLPELKHMGVDTLILAMRTMFDADVAGDLAARYRLVPSSQPFSVSVGSGRFLVERGSGRDADAVLSGHSDDLAAIVFGGMPLTEAERVGAVSVEGDRRAVESLLGCFPLPPPVSLR